MNLDQTAQTEIMQAFEKGRRLYQLVHQTGYADMLDLFEAEVIKAEFRLLNLPAGSDQLMVRDVLTAAKYARSLFEQLQLRIHAIIEVGLEASELPNQLTGQAEYNNF